MVNKFQKCPAILIKRTRRLQAIFFINNLFLAGFETSILGVSEYFIYYPFRENLNNAKIDF